MTMYVWFDIVLLLEGYTSAYINISDYVNNLKYNALFLQEIDSIVIRKSIFNLDNAYQKMYKENKGNPKLKNSRKYYIHKITKKITDTYDIITVEKLHSNVVNVA